MQTEGEYRRSLINRLYRREIVDLRGYKLPKAVISKINNAAQNQNMLMLEVVEYLHSLSTKADDEIKKLEKERDDALARVATLERGMKEAIDLLEQAERRKLWK